MNKFTAVWVGIAATAISVALVAPAVSSHAATNPPAPTPVVSVTTLPALPSPLPPSAPVPTAHPVTSSAPLPAQPPTATPVPPTVTTPAPPPAGSLIAITGRVAKQISITIDQLRAMPTISLTMRVRDADGRHRFHIYTGASLPGIIDQAQPLTTGGTQTATAAWAVVWGLSGGPTVVAFPEFESDFGGHRTILAYTVDGKPAEPGASMLVIEGDASTARFVRGVTRIDVLEAAH